MTNPLDFLRHSSPSLLSDLVMVEFLNDIGMYESYLHIVEKFFQTEIQRATEKIEQLRATGKITDIGNARPPEEENYDETMHHLETFVDIQRKSFFVTLYSFCEDRIVSECRSRKRGDLPLSFSDLAGENLLDKAKDYFTVVWRK